MVKYAHTLKTIPTNNLQFFYEVHHFEVLNFALKLFYMLKPKDGQLRLQTLILIFPILTIYDWPKVKAHYNLEPQLTYLKFLETLSKYQDC